MVRLEDVWLFTRVTVLGSFSNAAREAGVLPGQVSAAILRLEQQLDTRLFARSTRSLRLTAEGEKYLPYAREMLSVMQAGQQSLNKDTDELQGTLRIALPSDSGRNLLLPWISEFCQNHRGLSLQLSVSDQLSDVFRDPIDVAIRYGIPDNRNYIARVLSAHNRRVLTASPEYLQRYGRPQSLDELHQHQCLLYSLNGHVYDKWLFPADQTVRQLTLTSRWQCDDADIARRWAVDGRGIVYKSWIDVSSDVAAGRLEIVLPQQPGEAAPLHLICPHRQQFSPAVRLLYNALSSHLQHITDQLSRYTGSNNPGDTEKRLD